MIVFLNEDRAYLSWITHHRTGFVVDCLRNPTKAHLVIHRAICTDIKHSESKHTHWTTGRHMKGCSLDLEELKTWANEQTESEPTYCLKCTPERDVAGVETVGEPHLTRMDRDILAYVLEISACHLEDDDHAYALTVGRIAHCLGKTEGQLTAAFIRLVNDGLLSISGKMTPGEMLSPNRKVLPTAQALRTLFGYADYDDQQIAAELLKLTTD